MEGGGLERRRERGKDNTKLKETFIRGAEDEEE